MSGSNFNKFTYAYDTRDVRTSVQQKYAFEPLRQVDYTYDAVDQLVGEAATGGVAATNYSNAYSYDAMGNRLKRENTQNTTTAMTRSGVNGLNQLTSVSTSVDGGPRLTGGLSYDAAGNLTEMATANGGRTLYVYDDADRLFRIEKRDAADARVSKSEFVYDYASRKAVSQEFTYTAGAWVKGSEKRRVFDGMDVIQERDENNAVTAQLVRDGNISGILSRSTAAGASFFSYDGSGNVTLLTDASGNEVGRYRYDAFGNTLEIAGTRAVENPYRFSTKELHGASGLYDFGFRFYSASLGRWINRDPLKERGGINLYGMVANNPINNVDSYGLYSSKAHCVALRAKIIKQGAELTFRLGQYNPITDALGVGKNHWTGQPTKPGEHYLILKRSAKKLASRVKQYIKECIDCGNGTSGPGLPIPSDVTTSINDALNNIEPPRFDTSTPFQKILIRVPGSPQAWDKAGKISAGVGFAAASGAVILGTGGAAAPAVGAAASRLAPRLAPAFSR